MCALRVQRGHAYRGRREPHRHRDDAKVEGVKDRPALCRAEDDSAREEIDSDRADERCDVPRLIRDALAPDLLDALRLEQEGLFRRH